MRMRAVLCVGCRRERHESAPWRHQLLRVCLEGSSELQYLEPWARASLRIAPVSIQLVVPRVVSTRVQGRKELEEA